MKIFSRFNTDYFFGIPVDTNIIWFWFGFFVLLSVASLVVYLFFSKKGLKAKPYKRYAKNFFWPNLTLSISGLFFVFSRFEKLPLFSWRFWIFLTIFLLIVFNTWYLTLGRRNLEKELSKFYNEARKSKWLNNQKSKNKK